MDKKDTNFWQSFGGTMRKALNQCPPTPKQAQAELDKLKSTEVAPFTDDEINDAISKVLAGDLEPAQPDPDLSWVSSYDTSTVDESVFALNRNKGDDDPDVDAEIDALRKKALDEQQSEKDQPGLEDRTKPPEDSK